jgi:hypothetical protein
MLEIVGDPIDYFVPVFAEFTRLHAKNIEF